ncbi:MAG: DUF2203 domain-containing protein [Gemmatimonadota bacterium]|nr:DUF2203 domain-containing protein [Gemmatimonadota bacterium]
MPVEPTGATLWTVERANRALPLVRRIVADLVQCYADWAECVERFELASTRSAAHRQDPEAEQLQREVQRMAAEIDGFVRELSELGVECKSMETGLVDFPAEREGRVVYLCWRHGEERVEHWHEVEGGFAGRQALP